MEKQKKAKSNTASKTASTEKPPKAVKAVKTPQALRLAQPRRPYTHILAPTEHNIDICATEIKKGGIVAFPTETVYGLGASVFDPLAIQRIFDTKGRPADNPLIVHVSSFWQIKQLVASVPEVAVKLAKRYMPGPLTIIYQKKPLVPYAVTAGLDSVAIRMPSNKVALELIEKAGVPIAAPSANRSGRPSPTTAKHVYQDLRGKLPYILDGGQCKIGVESTVIDVRGEKPVILRTGAIPIENIVKLVGPVDVAGNDAETDAPRCPGMKYRHYAPKANVVFSAYFDEMFISINDAYDSAKEEGKEPVILCLDENKDRYGGRETILLGKDYDEYARKLYAALRHADAKAYNLIIAEGVPAQGIGAAIVNRLVRASEGKIL